MRALSPVNDTMYADVAAMLVVVADLNDPAAISDRLTRATNEIRHTVADNIAEYARMLQ